MFKFKPKNNSSLKRPQDFREVTEGLAKKAALEEARAFPQTRDTHRHPQCPLGIDIPEFIRLLREGEEAKALDKIREANPFPGICGRICGAVCEDDFVKRTGGRPASIRALERYAADHGRPRIGGTKRSRPTGLKVAVVGSGPAGLTAAAFLAREGYQVTVFEALPFPGGRLRFSLPEFRCSRKVVTQEIADLTSLGVTLAVNEIFGRTVTWEKLRADGFVALFLACPVNKPSVSVLPGVHLNGVHFSSEILFHFCRERPRPFPAAGKILILGSSQASLDCARTLVRAGKDVTVIFEQTEDDLAEHCNDFELARQEGAKFQAMSRPVEVLSLGGRGADAVKCVQMDFADLKSNGQWELIPVPDSEFVMDTGAVIIDGWAQPMVLLSEGLSGERVEADKETGTTSVEGIFCPQAVFTGVGEIVDAMVSGKNAAWKIHEYLLNSREHAGLFPNKGAVT